MIRMTNPRISGELLPNWEKFAENIADGMLHGEAYRQAYDSKAKNRVCAVKACLLLKRPAVQAHIKKLKSELADKRALDRLEKRLLLAKAARQKNLDWGKRIKAIEVDNVMTGDNAPQEVQVFGLAELLAMVRKKQK